MSALGRGLDYLTQFQTAEGSLHGDYDGPLFLLPGLIFAHYATQTPLPDEQRQAFIRTIRKEQNPDGGFALHREGKSYLFTTVLNHVALRLLGVPGGDSTIEGTHRWIHAHGGALGIPSWGKYWLAILRLYEWKGINPVLPETWLLPNWFPLHPGRLWCHARMVYLPVSYLYGRGWQVPDAPLLAEIREEIYDRPYAQVPFHKARNHILANDLFLRHGFWLRRLHDVLKFAERLMPRRLRNRALAYVLDQIKHEQQATSFIDIGPVSKAFDVVATYAAEPGSEHTKKAIGKMGVYLFECENGLTMQSYNSSELWDTAFAVQAIVAAGQTANYPPFIERALRFIDNNQILEDVPRREEYFRGPSVGGWPFSNRAHGWPIVDCTAEGLKAAIVGKAKSISRERLVAAVDRLLDWQNADGGWPTYERNRGNRFLEWLNPSEMFGNIMCDVSFVELTSSAMQGLAAARTHFGDELGSKRLQANDKACRRGARFLRSRQRPDGSWEGAWGICFTYGTWFGVTGLVSQSDSRNEPALRRAADFLLSKQLADGGWGESYLSSVTGQYTHHPDGGQVVMTSWALLALLNVPTADSQVRAAIERGLRFLAERQGDNGDWPQASVTGVFNKNCMLHYRFYRNYFPIWALGLAKMRGYSAH